VSAATAVRLAQRQAQTGSLAPGRQGRPAGSGKLSAFREIVIGWVAADGEQTLPELAERLAAEHGVAVHPTSLSRLLRAAGFTVKKNASGQRDRSR
jgi:transposase